MSTNVENIQEQYFEGLKKFLKTKDEECLNRAYEFGRDSVRDDLSELKIIEFHHISLARLEGKWTLNGREPAFDTETRMRLASMYLKEWLAPYEVKLQSFRDVIRELNVKNEQLNEEIENRRQFQQELLDSKEYFQSLIEHGQDIITVIDCNGIIRYNSPSIAKTLGYDQNELVGREVFQHIHEEEVEQVKDFFNEVIETPNHVISVEFRFQHKDGHWIYLESIAKHTQDSRDGSIVIVNSRDITERKKTMRKLRDSKKKLAEAQKIANVGSWEWKPDNDPELQWSDEMCRIYGFQPKEFDHSFDTYLAHIHPDDKAHVIDTIEYARKNGSSFSFEHKIIRFDGNVRTLLCRGQTDTNQEGEVAKMLGTAQDVTEQKQKEQKLRDYSERLRKLSAKIEQTREEERVRIAREIHDELGQMLTVLKMDVSMMSGQMKKKVSDDVLEYFNNEAGKILDRINTIIQSVQRITTSLRPEVLDDLGLKEAVEWQAREFQSNTKIQTTFDTNLQSTDFLNEQSSTTLFRILQETLTNIMRHADATKVNITLNQRNSSVYLIVEDNGKGITEEQMHAPNAFGIIGMRERTQFLGGDVKIKGKKAKGTRVIVRIPLEGQK